jgi:cytochrome c5
VQNSKQPSSDEQTQTTQSNHQTTSKAENTHAPQTKKSESRALLITILGIRRKNKCDHLLHVCHASGVEGTQILVERRGLVELQKNSAKQQATIKRRANQRTHMLPKQKRNQKPRTPILGLRRKEKCYHVLHVCHASGVEGTQILVERRGLTELQENSARQQATIKRRANQRTHMLPKRKRAKAAHSHPGNSKERYEKCYHVLHVCHASGVEGTQRLVERRGLVELQKNSAEQQATIKR